MARVFLQSEGKPKNYTSGYANVDDYIKRNADTNFWRVGSRLEDATSIQYDNKGDLVKNPVDIRDVGRPVVEFSAEEENETTTVEKGVLEPNPVETSSYDSEEPKTEINVVSGSRPDSKEEKGSEGLQIVKYTAPQRYQNSIKRQIRYAAGTSAIIALISLL